MPDKFFCISFKDLTLPTYSPLLSYKEFNKYMHSLIFLFQPLF